jgi:hypothetical protein
MSGDLEQPNDGETQKIERAIVMQVLRDDHAERWSTADLAVEIFDFAPATRELALERLERAGVVCRAGESVWASRATCHLDELELIGI